MILPPEQASERFQAVVLHVRHAINGAVQAAWLQLDEGRSMHDVYALLEAAQAGLAALKRLHDLWLHHRDLAREQKRGRPAWVNDQAERVLELAIGDSMEAITDLEDAFYSTATVMTETALRDPAAPPGLAQAIMAGDPAALELAEERWARGYLQNPPAEEEHERLRKAFEGALLAIRHALTEVVAAAHDHLDAGRLRPAFGLSRSAASSLLALKRLRTITVRTRWAKPALGAALRLVHDSEAELAELDQRGSTLSRVAMLTPTLDPTAPPGMVRGILEGDPEAIRQAEAQWARGYLQNPYPYWDPQPNPFPYVEPDWEQGWAAALGVNSWARVTIELLRAAALPGEIGAHSVLRGPRPLVRIRPKDFERVYRKVRRGMGKEGATPTASRRAFERWKRRTRDYGLERLDAYDPDHVASGGGAGPGWFAFDYLGAADAIWAVWGPPHPLEAEIASRYGGFRKGEAREFDLLAGGLDKLETAYETAGSIAPVQARQAFTDQLDRHSRFYTEPGELLPERSVPRARYVRHYTIYDDYLQRTATTEAERRQREAEGEAMRAVKRAPGEAPKAWRRYPHPAWRPKPKAEPTPKPRQRPQAKAKPRPPKQTKARAKKARPAKPEQTATGLGRYCPECKGPRYGRGFRHTRECPVPFARYEEHKRKAAEHVRRRRAEARAREAREKRQNPGFVMHPVAWH